MPQFVWEGLFSVLNVLVPGVVMALFAAYYQNRRKREIKIEGELAVDRIDGYERILNCLYEGQELHEVSIKEEKEAETILDNFDVETFHCECPDAFCDESSFDAYYEKLQGLQRDCQIYLDDEASRQLDKSVGFYSQLKLWLDAFSDTEHAVNLGLREEVARKHIDWMYKLTGMMMFNHCTRAYAMFDRVVCKQINRLSLTYRKHRLQKAWRRVWEAFLHLLDVSARKQGWCGKLSQGVLWLFIGKEERDMGNVMETMTQVMCYVHFSDRYSPRDYFELKRVPSDKEMQLFWEVYMAMLHQS